jgi:hypothetical protein
MKTITVKLTPGAKCNEIQGWEEDLFGEKTLKVSVTAIPEKGRANKALVEILSKEWGVAKSKIRITRGIKSRVKILEIDEG